MIPALFARNSGARLLVLLFLSMGVHAQQRRGAFDSRPILVTPEHQEAVERGLDWLAAHQNMDGSWTAQIGYKLNSDYRMTGESGHVGVTALSCMAFLAGGHLPGRGTHGDAVEAGLDFVLNAVKEDGYVTHGGTRMYSHAFATLFLAEIF